jgi:hypothetical protein
MKTVVKLFIALVLVASPAAAQAHGSLFTFKQIDGTNVVMVTHNVHDAQSGIPITYNLKLYNIDGQLMPFQKVEAEIQQNNSSLTKQTLNATANQDANFTYSFPKQGEYKLLLTFIDNGKPAARGDFPIIVQKGLDQNFFADFFTTQSLVAFLLGAGAVAAYWQRKKLLAKLARLAKKKKASE